MPAPPALCTHGGTPRESKLPPEVRLGAAGRTVVDLAMLTCHQLLQQFLFLIIIVIIRLFINSVLVALQSSSGCRWLHCCIAAGAALRHRHAASRPAGQGTYCEAARAHNRPVAAAGGCCSFHYLGGADDAAGYALQLHGLVPRPLQVCVVTCVLLQLCASNSPACAFHFHVRCSSMAMCLDHYRCVLVS